MMIIASTIVASGELAMPTWLVLTYLFHTFGELAISPVGMSATTEGNSAEFFAFYGIAGRFASVVGPLVYGSAYALLGIRTAILSLAVFFIAGLAILLTVDEQKGVEQAETAIL